jgi:hypothetical protein
VGSREWGVGGKKRVGFVEEVWLFAAGLSPRLSLALSNLVAPDTLQIGMSGGKFQAWEKWRLLPTLCYL